MKIFLAGCCSYLNKVQDNNIFILESFYYIRGSRMEFLKKCGDFLLDSGAFTYMTNSNKNENWDLYIEEYANFINKFDIKHFFELDIDSIVGLKEVERLREKLETLTGKKCIPVWHKSRGKEYFLRMCEKYKYVAIGGIVSKEIKESEYHYLKWLVNEASKRGAKVHGLGFTNTKWLKSIQFYSVDSTSYASGNRFGIYYLFINGEVVRQKIKNKRVKNGKGLNLHNFKEWVKFQKYALKNM